MKKRVTLVASDIQVTADSESRALSYLREDAGQFRRDWNYDDVDVEDTDDEITDDADEADIDVSVDTPRGRGERIWTGEAHFSVVVEAANDVSAYAAARELLAA